ncbi:MAG: filamentous hemagglutinin N-terminal domain-containing protein, partial [Cyanobacteria bacterium P01_F01_bin.4]
SIVPSAGSAATGTVITPDSAQPNVYDVTGGAVSSGDAPNLFHHLQQFNLEAGDVANFETSSDISNIINLIEDLDPSFIDGLLQVSGSDANLFVINPNGVIFGSNAQLNLAGSLTVSTADSLIFDSQSLEIGGVNGSYATFVGDPTGYVFSTPTPGAIENNANLAVNTGESITLLGGTVQSDGTLSAPEGEIALIAVPGEGVVRLSQVNSLLSLEIDPLDTPLLANEVSLPTLLTGGQPEEALQIGEAPNGEVTLTAGNPDLTQPGSVVSSGGSFDVSDQNGGNVYFIGEQVALFGVNVDTSGLQSGGGVYIGGIPEATDFSDSVLIDRTSVIAANGQTGDGGTVFVWSDGQTRFYGQVDASGVTADGEIDINSNGILEQLVPQNRP